MKALRTIKLVKRCSLPPGLPCYIVSFSNLLLSETKLDSVLVRGELSYTKVILLGIRSANGVLAETIPPYLWCFPVSTLYSILVHSFIPCIDYLEQVVFGYNHICYRFFKGKTTALISHGDDGQSG